MKMFGCKFQLNAGLFPCGIADTIFPASVVWGAEIQI
jgi:hypothetical protein